MNIYIPSKGRADIQRTFVRLPSILQQKTFIVVPEEERNLYAKSYPNSLPCPVVGIAPTRDWIIENARKCGEKKLVMLDDDLIFQRKREDGRITNCTFDEMEQAFQFLDRALDDYVHAGFSVRFSDRGSAAGNKEVGRMMHVLAYNVEALPKDVSFCNGVSNPQTFSMDDFNMTLQLLTRQYPNIISSEWRTSPAAGNARGGASTWRTLETQNRSAEQLQKLFPNFVSLRAKKNWQGIEGGQMFDVTVQWQKAYRSFAGQPTGAGTWD